MTDHDASGQDRLFAKPLDNIADFRFDQDVVKVFPDMIQRSVPGYTTIIHMIGQMAQRYSQSGTRCYDLGCSLGAATLAMRHRISSANTQIIAVDSSADMIERCQQVVAADSMEIPVQIKQQDIVEVEIFNASVIVLNFTLQFVPLEKRERLMQRIYDGMVPGGILILSEKLNFDSPAHNDLMIELHHYFKKTNGYSDMEIAQKRNAIENVLIPETFDTHQRRLSNIGFKNIELWFQCFNFASFIAFK